MFLQFQSIPARGTGTGRNRTSALFIDHKPFNFIDHQALSSSTTFSDGAVSWTRIRSDAAKVEEGVSKDATAKADTMTNGSGAICAPSGAHHRVRAIRGWACLTAPGALTPNISRNSGHSGDTPRQSTRQEMSIPAPRVVQNRNRSQNVTSVETNLETHTEAANVVIPPEVTRQRWQPEHALSSM